MNIAVFYHAYISGARIKDPNFALNVLADQMAHLKQCGLDKAASEIHIGVNGTEGDALLVSALAADKATIHIHGPKAQTELPTFHVMQQWLSGHDGWLVLYFHTKGVSHGNHAAYNKWRDRMEYNCVEQWQRCVQDLNSGYDAVGCHWLTPQKYPAAVSSPFFGGTFWWSKVKYLVQLPKLPPDTYANRFEAESWIGRRRPYPLVKDYLPGWP